MSLAVERDEDVRRSVAADASGLVLVPEGVARPASADEVAELLRRASAEREPVTPAGAQTSTTAASITDRGVLLSLGPVGDKYRFTDEARELSRQGLALYATPGTAEILHAVDIPCETLDKDLSDATWPTAMSHLRAGKIDLVINIPREYDEKGRPDGFRIRRAAIDLEIPLVTDLWLARKLVWAMRRYGQDDLKVKAWAGYLVPA
jgi:hypothetical protein